MSDITMCSGEGCKKREFCWRFTAIPKKDRQSYFDPPPINSKGECDEYWENKCPYCGQFAGIHKLSCKSGKRTVFL
jgi:hypothetical protein